jgi:hypothetical protein
MRSWQVERRKRTRHLIELGGLVVKCGIVDLTGDDRRTIFGALLWCADKLQRDQGEQARVLWVAKGKQAFEEYSVTHSEADPTVRRFIVDILQQPLTERVPVRSDVPACGRGKVGNGTHSDANRSSQAQSPA